MAPHWHDVVKRILDKNLRLHITTNGTLLKGCAEKLLALCSHPGSLDITVSLDGLNGRHDSIRGVEGTFVRALDGIRTFARLWEDRGWQLHLVVARTRRCLGLPLQDGAAAYARDPRAHVRKQFTAL